MTTILVRDIDGTEHRLQAADGATILQTMLDAGLPVKATCYGCCICSTCHVRVDLQWLDRLTPAEETETDSLEQVMQLTPQSRLSCQIIVQPELEGLEVTLTEDTVP